MRMPDPEMIDEDAKDAERYRWLRVRLAGAAHVNELEEYNQTMHGGLANDVDAAIDVHLSQPAERVRVPDGWKLVPIEPTQEMIGTALRVHGDEAFIAKAPALVSALVKIHKAMLSAALEANHYD